MNDETYYIDILGAFISDQKLIELEQNLKSFNLMEVFNLIKANFKEFTHLKGKIGIIREK